MRSEWYFRREVEHVLAALTPANRLACEVSLQTGLRIGDVLRLQTEHLSERFTIQEEKTGKNRTVRLPRDLVDRLLRQAGKIWVFPHRLDGRKHRTRQAVYKDICRARKLFRIPANVTPHSLRKVYAVDQFHSSGDLKKVQRLLNHSSEAVTMIYALADAQLRRHSLKKEGEDDAGDGQPRQGEQHG